MRRFDLRLLSPKQRVLLAAAVFTVIGWALQWWRMQTLNASMDQGILYQVLWNGLRGHPFESTLSSQLSTNVVHDGQLPALGYHRLGQHFTPTLLLWLPLVAMLGKWALPMLQVTLISAAGLVLYQLARERLEPKLASQLTLAFYGANAVIGPALGNFTDLSQLPLCVFVLLLGLKRKQPWLITPAALLLPLIREDTGVVLIGVALWLLYRDRKRWPLALTLMAYGGAWVMVATNVLMPLFSEDNSRRFMVENFGQYLQGREKASSLDVATLVIRQPVKILQELVNPPRQTLAYLAGQGLPLLFVPFIAIDSWLLMGLPLLGLLLAQGSNNPLSINIRYTYLVVPGMFAGCIGWWHQHSDRFNSRGLRQLWSAAIILSLLFTVTSNPNRSLSWLIPDSVQPWLYRNPVEQWRHGAAARHALNKIPKEASLAASTPLIPHAAGRQALVRFPDHWQYQTRSGEAQDVDWIAVDLKLQERFGVAFSGDRRSHERSLQWLGAHKKDYAAIEVNDGVVLLQRYGAPNPKAEQQLSEILDKNASQND